MGPNDLTDEFYAFLKSKKCFIFMIDTYLKTVQLKGMQTFNFLSIEGIRKGYLFGEK